MQNREFIKELRKIIAEKAVTLTPSEADDLKLSLLLINEELKRINEILRK
jgi:hypothetical protein